MNRSWPILIILLLLQVVGFGQNIGTKSIKIKIGETAWWSGVINHGELMPLKNGYRADFNNNYGNQVQPLLISNHGQTIWSEQAYTVEVKSDTLYVYAGYFAVCQ